MRTKQRVELHLHTRMSQMDALISPRDAVGTVWEWGHTALAITDHDSVYAFPEVMREAGVYGVKVLYGVEILCQGEGANAGKDYHQSILVKTQAGLKGLYRLISEGNMEHFRDGRPRYPFSVVERYREGLLIGSGCGQGALFSALAAGATDEEVEALVIRCDYLEIMPADCIHTDAALDAEQIRDVFRRIVALGERYGKIVVATGDVHFLERADELARKVLLNARGVAVDRDRACYLRTTEEMLEEFAYLGEDKAYEVVVENTNAVADMIEEIRPIPDELPPVQLEGEEEEMMLLCRQRLEELYEGELLERATMLMYDETSMIGDNGYMSLFVIAKRIVEKCKSLGYHVGVRGTVGSSLVAYLMGITDIDPLRYGLRGETLFGLYGDRVPDIDLLVPPEARLTVVSFLQEMLGEGRVVAAGTVNTLQKETARDFVRSYIEGHGVTASNREVRCAISRCDGVLRSASEHPGGLMIVPDGYEIEDITPVHRLEQDPETVTTLLPYHEIDHLLLKIDVLPYDVLAQYARLEELTGVKIADVPLDDPAVLALFREGETDGLPEFEAPPVRGVLEQTQPSSFDDLVKVTGLTHGTKVWTDNAEHLLKDGTCTLSDVIGVREDVMHSLIAWGMDREDAFFIMERVRKGKGLDEEDEEMMLELDVPAWFMWSSQRIQYLFPKAHAVAYTMMAVRLGWYKVYYPEAFRAAVLEP